MKFIVNIIFISTVFSQLNIDKEASFISYTGSHPFHDWTATTNNVNIDSDCLYTSTSCTIKISSPIISFNSGNENRDSNAFMLVDGLTFPMVSLTVDNFNMDRFLTGEINSVHSSLNLNSKSQQQEIPLILEFDDKTFRIKSTFKTSLESFNIKRPSLLFLPISDSIRINAHVAGSFIE